MSKEIKLDSLLLQFERTTYKLLLENNDSLNVWLTIREMSGDIIHKIIMEKSTMKETMYIATDAYDIDNAARVIKKHESYRDYVVVNVHVNDIIVGTSRIHLRGMKGESFRKECVLHRPGQRHYGHSSNDPALWFSKKVRKSKY